MNTQSTTPMTRPEVSEEYGVGPESAPPAVFDDRTAIQRVPDELRGITHAAAFALGSLLKNTSESQFYHSKEFLRSEIMKISPELLSEVEVDVVRSEAMLKAVTEQADLMIKMVGGSACSE
jgi:hypothetical protein